MISILFLSIIGSWILKVKDEYCVLVGVDYLEANNLQDF